uniref:Uncharacterized protein n=1 Tax=Anguilla anguilla TaxID=7936 RepID=A0A0E9RTM4_ANGAN
MLSNKEILTIRNAINCGSTVTQHCLLLRGTLPKYDFCNRKSVNETVTDRFRFTPPSFM